MLATLLGSISLTCLLASIVTDSWIYTEDIIASPSSFGRGEINSPTKIEFTIGLWKVCPTIIEEGRSILRSFKFDYCF